MQFTCNKNLPIGDLSNLALPGKVAQQRG
jgi:hypothetical protein